MNKILEILSVVGAIFASVFLIFKKGEKQGKQKAIEEINKEIKKEKEKIKKEDDKIKKEIADTKFNDRIKWLQQHAKNRRKHN